MAYGDTLETETIQIFSACYHYIGTYLPLSDVAENKKNP